jgi:pSer/pThr/pTyr-binding forkhead associated (FHA) protein
MAWVEIEIGATRHKRGQRVRVEGKSIVLGRSSDCTVYVEGEEVSRRHVALVWMHEVWRVQDLASANGTYLNRKRVTSAELKVRDVLRLGTKGPKVHVIELGSDADDDD